MFLTDSTEARQIAGGKAVAVYEPGKPALIIQSVTHAANLFTCGWELGPVYYEGDVVGVDFCTAPAVCFENGFCCTNGHHHRNDAEYYTAEELQGTINAGYALGRNARLV